MHLFLLIFAHLYLVVSVTHATAFRPPQNSERAQWFVDCSIRCNVRMLELMQAEDKDCYSGCTAVCYNSCRDSDSKCVWAGFALESNEECIQYCNSHIRYTETQNHLTNEQQCTAICSGMCPISTSEGSVDYCTLCGKSDLWEIAIFTVAILVLITLAVLLIYSCYVQRKL